MNAVTEKAPLAVLDTGEFNVLMDSDRFAQMQRVAQMFAQSDLVPEVFRGKPANCMVALQMAFRLKIDPLALMQSMYVVHGRPGLEAKMVIALINTRGPFEGPIQWRFDGEGKNRSCTAYATHRRTQERCEAIVDWPMVDAEGWANKQGSKWKTMPDVMFQYRSAAFLGRLYCPEVILGLATSDELDDMGEIVINPAPSKAPARKEVAMPQAKAKAEDSQPKKDSQEEGEEIDTQTGEITEAGSGWKPPKDPPPPPPVDPAPSAPPAAFVAASSAMKRIVTKKMEHAALTDTDLKAKFGKGLDELGAHEINDVMEWIADPVSNQK